jgi:hypothetical protein
MKQQYLLSSTADPNGDGAAGGLTQLIEARFNWPVSFFFKPLRPAVELDAVEERQPDSQCRLTMAKTYDTPIGLRSRMGCLIPSVTEKVMGASVRFSTPKPVTSRVSRPENNR